MATSPRGLLLRTAGLLAACPDEVDDLLFARGREIQAGAAEPADRSREGAESVVFRSRDDRDREMAAGDDRSDAALPRPPRSGSRRRLGHRIRRPSGGVTGSRAARR